VSAPAVVQSTGPAVRVEGVSKRFRRGERQDSLRDLIPSLLRRGRAAGRHRPDVLDANEFWAVRDVDFQVQFGRALGIIGPNGAGKSTMLKLLTGILRPSEGTIRMRGRVASLIEVAAGFHQDLTGRENVYLQGAIMGMTRQEVRQRLDSIIDFSGVEAFIDTPVKRYSSGMNARLGFAIAVHLDPDVLVIDEVLSVGDMAFQQKCVQRMKAFKSDGVAIIFVSHNMQAIGDLCDEALVIKSSPKYLGEVGQAVSHYLGLVGSGSSSWSANGVAVLGSALRDIDGAPVTAVASFAPLVLDVDFEFTERFSRLMFSLVLYRATDGLIVYDGNFSTAELGIDEITPGQRVNLSFEHTVPLTRGQYAYEVIVYDPGEASFRLRAMPVAGVRIDEYRTYDGVADLRVRPTLRPTALPR
jgi:lipopolysaccharide transport system ATP-binding protein